MFNVQCSKLEMEVSEKFQITLKISGQNFPITIKRDEEIFYREAEKLINQRYNFYANSYPGQANTTYLLMTIIEIAVKLKQQESSGNLQPVMATLNGLVDELNAALK